MTIEKAIIDFIDGLSDPYLNLTAKELNLDIKVDSDKNQTLVTCTAGFPIALLETNYQQLMQQALRQAFPEQNISVTFQQFIKAHRTQMVGKGLRGVKNTIAIASGKGGVGKSTVTVNLATALARLGARVGILDADIYGPSIPMMLGQNQPVQIQNDRYVPVQAHGVQAMSIGYLTNVDQALIWRGPMLAKSLIQMLDITLWDDLDYLFIDLPPGTGDIQLTLVQKIPLTAAIVVTTPQNIATLDAQKALTMFDRTSIDVLGVIENMSTHQCSNCGHEEPIFGSGGAQALCDKQKTKLLGHLPLDSRIRMQCDAGEPTASHAQDHLADIFTKTAMLAAIELAQKPLNYADRFPEIVVE